MAILFSAVKVSKAERATGGKNLIKRDKVDFIIRLRSAYKKDSLGQQNYKTLMGEAKFRGVENRTNGENGVIYVGERSKILADLDSQIAKATGDAKKSLEEQKAFISGFDGTKFWDITAKDMELTENLAMLLDFNKNNCL